MKRFPCLLLTVALLLALTGCGKASFSSPTTQQPSGSSSSQAALSVQEGSLTDAGLTLVITNCTDQELSYGMVYQVEQKQEDGWYAMDGERSFNAIAALLSAQSSNEFQVE